MKKTIHTAPIIKEGEKGSIQEFPHVIPRFNRGKGGCPKDRGDQEYAENIFYT